MKRPNPDYNPFLPYILIHIKNMNQKLAKILEGLYLDYYNFRFHHNHPYMCLYMVKKD
jgi:hypothetical protein